MDVPLARVDARTARRASGRVDARVHARARRVDAASARMRASRSREDSNGAVTAGGIIARATMEAIERPSEGAHHEEYALAHGPTPIAALEVRGIDRERAR